MFEWLTELFNANPGYTYGLLALLFLLCGLGLPIPEEILLITGGFLCYQGRAEYWIMTLVCAGAILVGDLLPFVLGSLFGPRLLRLKWLRLVINRRRLATFHRWFRRRGDLVILIARFIPGLRVVAFFTGGTMRMRWGRFLFLDLAGITLVVPTFVYLGLQFGDGIEKAFRWIQTVENSILYVTLAGSAVLGLWYGLRQRARSVIGSEPRETYVEPSKAARPPAHDKEAERAPEPPAVEGSAPSTPAAGTPAAAAPGQAIRPPGSGGPAGELPRDEPSALPTADARPGEAVDPALGGPDPGEFQDLIPARNPGSGRSRPGLRRLPDGGAGEPT